MLSISALHLSLFLKYLFIFLRVHKKLFFPRGKLASITLKIIFTFYFEYILGQIQA